MSERHLHHNLIATSFLIAAVIVLSFCGMATEARAVSSELHQHAAGQDISAGKEAGLIQMRPLSSGIKPYGLELAEVEQAYDATLYQVLSYFFSPGTFLLDVRVEATARTTDIHTASPEEAVRIITNLPGLPHFEEEATIPGRSATTISQLFTGIVLRRLHITIYADTSYGDEDLALMRQLVIAAAKAERSRGDQVHIISQPFPRKVKQPGWRVAVPSDTTDGVTGDAERIVTADAPSRETMSIKLKRPVSELPGLVLLISSALLIFVIITITISLRKRYV